ncbi:hypothetical protein CXF68_09285 [Tenacibaculum sp. Bg11-29]|nr:hypothetical protein CXF68_09285 [Tenacibaculum sp. Bg11-29]
MSYKIDLLMVGFLFVSGGNYMTGFGSLCIIIYHLSMLKMNVIDVKYKKSWKVYFKALFHFIFKYFTRK